LTPKSEKTQTSSPHGARSALVRDNWTVTAKGQRRNKEKEAFLLLSSFAFFASKIKKEKAAPVRSGLMFIL
jgi:hypothetical protein